ncbi:MFS general substrate transporter [Ophiobolus disseminans]|uniref:MFS general substrate transporter n=1 Tax=Ophiobolus disseminans TaxID=1469910 RepID=A0A6A7A974_9PLEO|nr:MFS general substrate transporter [Ophiobolus disseminans]
MCSTSLVAFTVVAGCTQAFGVFQAHYARAEAAEAGIVRPDELMNRALISAIGSLGNGGIVAVFAVFYYPHLPRIGVHVRTLCFTGTSFVVLGLATAAASQSVWHLFASQGALVGIGTGILLYVLAPILPEYFPKRSGLAQGTMFTAAAVGGTSFSLAITALIENVGIRGTLGILSAISLVTLSTASALALPPRKFEKRSTEFVGWSAFKQPLFACLFLVNLIHPLTLAVPMVFGPEFGESLGMGITKASYLLAVNSGVGILSRIPVGALADRIGHQNTLLIATSVYVLATWSLWLPSALHGTVGLYIGMSVCHGLINGVFNIVMNSAQKQLFGDEMYYPKNGVMTTIRGIGYVIGVPIAGALVHKVANEKLKGVDFVSPIVYVGTLLAISLACLLNVRRLDAKQSGWKWVR